MTTFTVKRGQTTRFIIYTPLETDIDGYDARCEMRKYETNVNSLDLTIEPDVVLAKSNFAGDEARGPGWYFELSANICSDLALGRYVLDARINIPNGDVEITNPWYITIVNHVTEPVA